MRGKYTYLIITFLIVASLITFGRIMGNDFVNLDDNAYITGNNYIQSGINSDSIKWAFTSSYFGYWHPITWISHMLDWNLFGANASGHHLMSLFLHIGSVLLLFFFLNKTTNNIWASAFAAAFFAFHPLRVESVGWAAERKDVLSIFFGMASIYAYAFYTESSKLSRHFFCFIFFTLALMSKPTMVTLPFALLLLDYWPLGRWQKAMDDPGDSFNSTGRIIMEKVPFILLSIASSIVTFYTQTNVKAVASIERLPILEHVNNAVISYAAYLGKTFWPVNLAVFYPYEYSLPLWKVLFSVFILIATTVVVLYYVRKLHFLFVGWFWYLGTMIPLIGLIQSGSHAMADRHTYLPSIGIAIILAWVTPYLFPRVEIRRNILFPVSIIVLAVLAILTWKQCGYWKNSLEIWNHALRVTNNNFLAYNSRGITYGEFGQYQRAIDDFNRAIDLKSDYFKAYNNRGVAYAKIGRYQQAVDDYSQAIHLKPDYAKAYNNRASIYLNQNKIILGCYDSLKACELGDCSILNEAKNKGYCR
jgi:protein O-mannosyl-transferase